MRRVAVVFSLVFCATVNAKVFPMIADPARIDQLRAKVEHILSLTEQQVRDMVPVESGGIYFTDCPNCGYGAEEAECFNTTWDPRRPKQLVCRGCEAVYPDNEAYPDDAFIEVDAPGGKKHRFHYWQREDGYRTWFRAHADYWAREWLQDQCEYLGDLYSATGDEECALRAAAILVRFAEVYPGWPTTFDYPFRQKLIHPYTVDRIPGIHGYRNSRWTWWAYMDIPRELIRGLDGIEAWPGWRDGDRQKIKRELFVPLIDFVLGIEESYSNMSMGMWRSAIDAGRVLREPRWVHEAVRRFEHLLDTRFLYDGHWMETSDSYASQTQGGLQVVMDSIDGYSDPPGYSAPQDGRRFDTVVASELVPGFDLARWTFGAVRFPDNRLLPVNDTWAAHGKTGHFWPDRVRDRMDPVLLPGAGLAVLGGGEGKHQLHAYLNYTKGVHHKQFDALSIGLFAFGKELFPDIGYTWTNYRLHWPNHMMSHNTVVVNGVDCERDASYTGYRLRDFVTDHDGFHLVSVDAAAAYPGITSRYRRTLGVVGKDSRDAYLIDIFEVHGGHQHDYVLLGSVDEDSSASVAGAPMRPFAGTLLNEGVEFQVPADHGSSNPPGHAFGFFTGLRSGDVTDETVTLDLRLAGSPAIGTRTILAPGPGATVYLGNVPSIRRARESNGLLDRDKAPAFSVRRQGAGLVSTFVAVHEAVNGQPKLQALRVEREGDAILLHVDRGVHGMDRFVQSLAGSTKATFGGLTFDGRYALVRAREAHLIGGTRLQSGKWSLAGIAGWSGDVIAVGREDGDGHRGWFDVGEDVDGGRYGTLIVHFADGTQRAYNVFRATKRPVGVRLYVREAPGFKQTAGGTQVTSFPQREIEGKALTYTFTGVTRARTEPRPD